MAHTIKEKDRLISRVKRIRGQVDGLLKALDEERECSKVLQIAAACRGALSSLLFEILDDHIENHIVRAKTPQKAQRELKELKKILRSYFK